MRRGPTALLSVAFLVTLLACNNVPVELANEATRPRFDSQCLAALAHVRTCDTRFPDRTILCEYSSDGECAPYLNGAQGECLTAASCDAVTAALDRGDWLCGVSLAKGVTR